MTYQDIAQAQMKRKRFSRGQGYRFTCSIRNKEISDLLEQVRNGMRGGFIESAVEYYLSTKEGKRMFAVLRKAEKESPAEGSPPKTAEA